MKKNWFCNGLAKNNGSWLICYVMMHRRNYVKKKKVYEKFTSRTTLKIQKIYRKSSHQVITFFFLV
jgi:hypothetical protein